VRGAEAGGAGREGGGLCPELLALLFGEVCIAAPEGLLGLLELLEERLGVVEHGRSHGEMAES
jgi:hypothetical protein